MSFVRKWDDKASSNYCVVRRRMASFFMPFRKWDRQDDSLYARVSRQAARVAHGQYKSQAESARQHAVRCKDRIEELAYRVNGLAAGAL